MNCFLTEDFAWNAVKVSSMLSTLTPLPLHSRLEARKLWPFSFSTGFRRDLRGTWTPRLGGPLASSSYKKKRTGLR